MPLPPRYALEALGNQVACMHLFVSLFFSIFTALHGMQTRSRDEISVSPSVCPSVCLSVCQTRAL